MKLGKKKKPYKTHDLPPKNRAGHFMNNFYASDGKLQILSRYCTVHGTKHLHQLFLGGVTAEWPTETGSLNAATA